jgi:restriction endonuclease S subunit
MQKKLSQLSSMVSGYNFRHSVENESNGDICVVQGKNIVINQDILETKDLVSVSTQAPRAPYFLQRNDVLLVSRGLDSGTFRSAVYITENKKVIASSSVQIIRIADVSVLPKFVSLYLNSPEGQKKLLQIATGGSYIKTILIKNLNDLKIPIPPMHTQKLLINLYENILDQEKIMDRKKEIQQNIIKTTFNNLK